MRVGMVRRSARFFGLAAIAVAALGATRASAQPGHDAFDKPLGYDTGREEQAAHNYLEQTGGEDAYGNSQNGNNGGYRRAATRMQNGQQNPNNQNRRNDNDDDAQHHAALGVSLREADGRVAVIAVLPGSPAAGAGLRAGDIIRYVGDQRIATAQGLAEEIGEYRPGSQVELSIRRDGEKQTLTAQLGSRQAWMRDRNSRNRDDNRMAQNNNNNNQTSQDGQSDGRRVRFSMNPATGQQQSQVNQQIQDLQQRLSQMQQELNNLRASLNENR